MGIYDRDYYREGSTRRGRGRGGGAASLTMWSVNTWLIVLCAAVFFIDGFLPGRWVRMNTHWVVDNWHEIDPSAIVEDDNVLVFDMDPDGRVTAVLPRDEAGNVAPPAQGHRRFYGVHLMVKTAPGQPVGVREVWGAQPLQSFLHFSTQRGFLQVEFWRLIGFQFLHADLTHLIFNMLGLFFFGPLVETYLGAKRYLAFYLLCGIFGALLYCVLNLGGVAVEMMAGKEVHIPGLLFNDPYTPLIGASAGVFGVIMAGAYLAPNATVLLFFILPLRLATFAWLLVGFAVLVVFTSGNNAGGQAGHLGGAAAGYYLIRHPRHLHGFFDVIGWADPTSHHYRGRKDKSAAAARRTAGSAAAYSDVDRILDKISAEGLASLTDEEKRILRATSRNQGS